MGLSSLKVALGNSILICPSFADETTMAADSLLFPKLNVHDIK